MSDSTTPRVVVNFHDGSQASFPGRVISADPDVYQISDGAGNLAFVPFHAVKYLTQCA